MKRLIYLLIAVGALSACATDPVRNGGLPTSSNEIREPGDDMIDVAVQSYLKANHGPLYSKYDYTRVDLDGDGRRDALVMFSGPHSYWCDMNGCSLAVLKASNDGFAMVSESFPVRGPLYIAESKHDGWRNLIVRVSGQAYADAKNVAMEFDGLTYPRNPFFLSGIQVSQADFGQKVFP